MALPTPWWTNPHGEHNYVKDPTSGGLSVGQRMAAETNAARYEKLGVYPARPVGSNGYTYSTGK